jgi:hypothetical protein
MATSEISTIPQLEEICREAVRIEELGDDPEGTISEAASDVSFNDDVITLMRKAIPEIERLVVLKATDEEDGWYSSLLEDQIGALISKFLIASARIQKVTRKTRCARSPRQTRKQNSQTLNLPQQPSTIKTFSLPPAKIMIFNLKGKAVEDVMSADRSYMAQYFIASICRVWSEKDISALARWYRMDEASHEWEKYSACGPLYVAEECSATKGNPEKPVPPAA